ncbi:MAG TPA: hypothetical protein VFY38_05505 [Pseudonocardia sp.]|nr:hypothetical protein [Pseudonocardia sp.]
MTILEEAIAGAGVDPRELHAKLMAGRQGDTLRLAQAFEEAGTVARESYERSRRAHGAIAGGFFNNGGAVLDAGAQDAQAFRLLGQGGQDMHDVAEMLRRSVRALDDAQAASTAATDRMVADLNAVVRAFNLDLRTGGVPADRLQFVSRAVEIVKAAAADIRRITETYDGVLTRDGAQLAGRGYAGAPVAPGDRFSPEAARRDAERLRAALADPDAKDVLLDDATTTLQALDAQVRSGHPLTAEQQRYITDFANIAGTDALVALPGLADTGVQQGADRAEAAVAGTLSALTNPELGGTADVGALPAVLRTLTDDPLSAVDDPGRRTDLVHQLEALPRYEGVNQLLGATSVPLGDQFSVTAGQQAIKTSQLTAQVLDRQHFPLPLGFNTDAYRPELEAAARGSSLQLTNVSRNLDAAQTLLLDADTRKSLLVTRHVDPAGAVTLLERATARVVPVDGSGPAAEAAAAVDAQENAQVAAAVLTDVAQDPYGWRDAIGKGTPVSDAITGIVVDNIDAFGRNSDAAVDVFTPARVPEGQYGGFSLGRQDAQDVLTFVGAGRPADGPDADLVRVHVAAQQYTQHEIAQAALGAQDPGTAFSAAGSVNAAVNTADFRSAMHVHDDADAARKSLFENGSLAAGVVVDKAVEIATAPLPGLVGDGVSALVDQAIDGYAPEDTAGRKGTDLVDAIYGRQSLEADHLVVSTLEQAGKLPADAPDLAAVTDATGRVSSLESFRDGNPDPDVTALGVPPSEALARIARHGPAGAGPDWEAAVRGYQDSIKIELARLDPDYANPDPRVELESGEVDRLQGKERVPWGFM